LAKMIKSSFLKINFHTGSSPVMTDTLPGARQRCFLFGAIQKTDRIQRTYCILSVFYFFT
ncbi:hypothetical protein, partial [Bacillus toyonensis]|uniref:hypothetical protein n=1 Tax=Bacillus toyonensis TaxID=155322 RepID=UPI000BFAEDD1